jgi:3-deoxy-D-manno-octulosonate 8-phosphate phosphatase (KDO 8-P phosphatase)
MSKARAKKIKLILFDVDGVLTDGKIWILPACRSATDDAGTRRETSGRGWLRFTESDDD